MANKGARGQQRAKPFRDALQIEINAALDGDNPRSIRRIARSLLEKAGDGDVAAIKEVADRLDGKVPQAIVGDDEHDPVTVREIITGVPLPDDAPTD